MNEADTCRKYVVPQLQVAGWDTDPHSIAEQRSFTDGRIVVAGTKPRRLAGKRADYLLRYTRDVPIAVVEAKADYKTAGDGMQQAKDYAEILGLKFAYATNGESILEFDYLTGAERKVALFPSPDDLWARLRGAANLTVSQERHVLEPTHTIFGKVPRYYQEIAINRAVQAVAQGQRRVLLTLATGTGKTFVSFQICWKLWSSGWNRDGTPRKPRILFLADRKILVDDPYSKEYAAFGEARQKIEGGKVVKSREMYFAIYQAIAGGENRTALFKEYAPDFFDLIVVDECHRGSAKDESSWRDILEHFSPAYQIGMTATPLREDNRDTYRYFGGPMYEYSLKQGIDDGFLAPYRVHRILTTYDAAGWRPSASDIERYGRDIPDRVYGTGDFERVVALRARTEAIARHLTDFLKSTDRFAKTIVFCVDQEHADEMRRALGNLNADLVQQYPDYVCRVTADEGDIGRGHLSRFQDLDKKTPVILTTSQLLSTGVDAPMVKNIAIVRTIGSMVEFKQIIGRGTRVRDDYGKLYFNILDYTGSATANFADPQFDGWPAAEDEEEIDDDGKIIKKTPRLARAAEEQAEYAPEPDENAPDEETGERRKFYVDGGEVQIAAHLVYELDSEGKQLRVVKYTDYTAERVRSLFPTAAELQQAWANPDRRADIIDHLAQRGIDFDELARVTAQPDADPFDLVCNLAFSAPIRTRRERADRLKKERKAFFEKYSGSAREVLEELLAKYTEHGTAQFVLPDVLKVPPVSQYGNVIEIAKLFGGPEKLRDAVTELQTLLYAA
jgi:type I restriction enzyme, R subunit